MTQELVFHLGDRKTGSTSIQDSLRTRNWLGSVPDLIFSAKRMHHADFASAAMPGGMTPGRQREMRDLVGRVTASTAQISVISSENFEDSDPALVQKLLNQMFPELAGSARFISYVRPHADRVLSNYAERLKLGSFTGSIDQFVDRWSKNGKIRYHPRFSRWREVFGDRFELRPMIRAQLHQNCVVRDFLGFAFKSTDFKLKVEPESNMSLSVEYLSLLLHLHKHLAMLPQDAKAQETIGRNFAIVMSAVPLQKSTKLAMTALTFARVREMYEADAVALDRDFFTGDPMMEAMAAAGQKLADQPQSFEAKDHFNLDAVQIIEAWSQFTTQMTRNAPETWLRYFKDLRTGGVSAEAKAVSSPSVTPRPQKGRNLAHRPSKRAKSA